MRLATAGLLAAICILAGCDSVDDPSNGLVGYWGFNGGDFVADESGNGLDAVSYGAVVGAGRIGTSVHLDGSSFLRIPFIPATDTHERSMSLWFYKANATVSDGYEAVAWTTQDSTDSHSFSITLYEDEAPFRVGSSFGSGSDSLMVEQPSPDTRPGRWYHYVIVVSRDAAEVYMDGTLLQSRAIDALYLPTGESALLGAAPVLDGATRFFNGRIDEVRIYDRALSSEDVRLLYDSALD